LYLGTFIFAWGIFILYPTLSILIAVSIITIYTLIAIQFEEKKLVKEFGEVYKEYQRRVPMIIPRLSNQH
jgi:protein-S-isoprenylcysteine O-methyltransferase Ste14